MTVQNNLIATIVQSGLCKTTAKFRPTPTMFCFPGLSSQPFYKNTDFPWIKGLEAAFQDIKNEYLQLRAQNLKSDYDPKSHSLHQGQWEWHSYLIQGKRQPQFAAACPKTTDVLESIPGFMVGTPFSFAFFSTLHGSSNIEAHCAPCNLRLRVHFPLIVPPVSESTQQPECGIRVADEVQQWKEGKAMIFDDAFEHEVWNRTAQERVLLLFDIWHPELIAAERASIEEMFGFARSQGWLK
mmetsp:Transcript_14255/g.18684  ORF Transcript_14255/g.18684 Transcript_14255/m.18684 type:complete len:240 (+) Transcript_14255:200-919(+)|eukprot:CAMPEP_0117740706 /NCGR_PEP_ID=MMETSP0947-20121206/4497_1 /TAXON_ID=44440 /ORGANISM="Chattonella subsalsa, Strain CCMP2191" /LENGTH=239 /DNA_ID=CAMNT_0005556863 /DNA_START=62 /DNA_END=781 /DNA_ORIENTATION=+